MIPSEPAPSDDPTALQAMLAAERVENERLRKIIRELQRHRFGRRAESLPLDQPQLGLEEAVCWTDGTLSVGCAMATERDHLVPCVAEGFDLADIAFLIVDKQGCVAVRTNHYSVPSRAGTRVEARIYPTHVDLWHGGRRLARHERCYGRRQHVLDLDHHLDVLSHKPGAFAGSKPLEQWRQAGRWPAWFDSLWDRLRERHGRQNGTRAMMAVVQLGREFGHDRLREAVAGVVALGTCDLTAVRYLLTEASLHKRFPDAVDVGHLAAYDRPMPSVADYDTLLSS